MNETPPIREQRALLASLLAARRDELLQAWLKAVADDPELTIVSALSRTQFFDHIPEVLDAFERRLKARSYQDDLEAVQDEKDRAGEHGLLRWQQGYHLREAMREWSHLHLCVLNEVESLGAAHPELSGSAMLLARRELAELFGEGACASAGQFAYLQQADAMGRLHDLQKALTYLKSLERQRAETWREAAHDLRGNLGVVKNATTVLNVLSAPEAVRASSVAILQRGVESLHVLLDDLLSLARLEAGQEERKVERFDAGSLLDDLCTAMQAVAGERHLYLKTEGPHSLPVEGDSVMTRRIVQNLVLNALKYTSRGGVVVTWQENTAASPTRWVLCVQDTGPGFEEGAGLSVPGTLSEATQEAHAAAAGAERPGEPSAQLEHAPTLLSETPHRPTRGEGIGLSIVKRLCELLDAILELETAAGQGSTFRVTFPSRYT